MKVSSTLQIRLSGVREKLNGLAAKTEPLSDEESSQADALHTEHSDLETKYRASLVVEGDAEERSRELFADDPASVELRGLIRKSNVGRIFDAVMSNSQTTGPEAELQAHRKLAGNQVPIELLQERAVTPGPTVVGVGQEQIVPYVFPRSAAEFLSYDIPTVPAGEAVFPVLTSALSVETPAKNASTTETTGSFTAVSLSPGRLQSSYFFAREDVGRFAGMSESLRMNLSQGLSDGLDKQILSGTNGLLTSTNLANHAASAVTTFANYVSNLGYGRVDGRFAPELSDLRVVMGQGTFAHAGTVYRGSNSDENAIDRLMRVTSGVRVSAHVPAVSGAHKQNAVIRLGMARDAVAPVWSGVTILDDQITKASSGQVVLTAILLHAVQILRADGFYKQETQHA